MTEAMAVYGMVFAKLAIGLLAIILQINLMGKGNLAPTSALDQLQNYVLGGIIGAIIYNDQIGILQFMLVLILWTILVMTLKFLKGNLRFFKTILDGHPVIVIEKGHILTEECMRYGIQAAELKLNFALRVFNMLQMLSVPYWSKTVSSTWFNSVKIIFDLTLSMMVKLISLPSM